MTAEIVIMNKEGIALAADSAGTSQDKVCNSVNKVFMLSKYQPVGIMIYGESEIMGYPWGTIIKMYQKSLNADVFDTLELQVDHFLEYLRTSVLFDEESKYYYFDRMGVKAIMDIFEELDSLYPNPEKTNKKLMYQSFDKMLDDRLTASSENFLDREIPAEEKTQGIEFYRHRIDKGIAEKLSRFGVDQFLRNKVYKFIENNVFCNPVHMGTTGIVITGFGVKDVFPVTISFEIVSIFDNKIFMSVRNHSRVANGSFAYILPFAQKDVIISFITGINPDLNKAIGQELDEIFDAIPQAVVDSAYKNSDKRKKQIYSLIENSIKSAKESLLKSILCRSEKCYSGPVLESASISPPHELAIMAETLINLTSFKRRVSYNEQETVGGPIDVAIITKGDGFVWIKRKEYFPAEKNPHFFANCYRD